LLPFVEAARRGGVRHVIFLSVAGAEKNKLVPHHAVERFLVASRGWTLLRPGFFAQNFGDAYRRDIVEDARVYVPAGRGCVAFVDVRDIAEVAAMALASPAEHDGHAYTLTGAEAVNFASAAATLSDVLGRAIRYEPASLVGYVLHLRARGMPWAQVGVQTVLHAGLRLGQAEHVDRTLERLLGRRPRSLHEYMRDHRATWDAAR
ncbi:MAG: NmrA family NAD(P)-binding protein, partial [Polyangiaceae bacterium]